MEHSAPLMALRGSCHALGAALQVGVSRLWISGVIPLAVPTETSPQTLRVFAFPQALQRPASLVTSHFPVGGTI